VKADGLQLVTLPIEPWRFHYGRHPEQGRQTTPFFASTGVRIANGWPWPRPSSRLQKARPVYIYRNQECRTILDSTIEDAKALGMTDETSLEALRVEMLSSMALGHSQPPSGIQRSRSATSTAVAAAPKPDSILTRREATPLSLPRVAANRTKTVRRLTPSSTANSGAR